MKKEHQHNNTEETSAENQQNTQPNSEQNTEATTTAAENTADCSAKLEEKLAEANDKYMRLAAEFNGQAGVAEKRNGELPAVAGYNNVALMCGIHNRRF